MPKQCKARNNIRHIISNILCAHWWFGGIFAAFGCSLPKLPAKFVQLARGVRTVSIVIPDQKGILPLSENKVRDIHDARKNGRSSTLVATVVLSGFVVSECGSLRPRPNKCPAAALFGLFAALADISQVLSWASTQIALFLFNTRRYCCFPLFVSRNQT